jgi:hypothetical protein
METETELEMRKAIRRYITNSASMDIDAFEDDMLIFEQGLLDSMGLLFLIDFIKEEFKVEVKDNELIVENFESVNTIASFVHKRLKRRELVHAGNQIGK